MTELSGELVARACPACAHAAHGTLRCPVLTCDCKPTVPWWRIVLAGAAAVVRRLLRKSR